MSSIVKNTIIKYQGANRESPIWRRILWVDVKSDIVFEYSLQPKYSIPEKSSLSSLLSLIDAGVCSIEEENIEYSPLLINEGELSEKQREQMDKDWELISKIVEQEPDIYDAKKRAKLIAKTVKSTNQCNSVIYRKIRTYWRYGMLKFALLHRDFKKGANGMPSERKRGRPYKSEMNNIGINATSEIKKIILGSIEKHYHTPKKLTLRKAYEEMLRESFNREVEKYYYSNDRSLPLEVPSYDMYRYYYKKMFDARQTVPKRFGESEFERNSRALVGNSMEGISGPGSVFQIDATIGDIHIVSRDDRSLIIGRPVIYSVVDVFSRYIVGFYVGLEGPSWLGAMMAIYNTSRNKVELCAEYGVDISHEDWDCNVLPSAFSVDRGELASTKPMNLLGNLQVDINVMPPFRPDLKGVVEQSFRRLNLKSVHFLPGAVRRDYRVRGDKDPQEDAILTLQEFTKILIGAILELNNDTLFKKYKMSPDMKADHVLPIPKELWKWGVINRTGRLRTYPADYIKANLMPSDNARIYHYGLVYRGRRYSCEDDVKSGLYVRARAETIRVRVSYDPRDMRRLYVLEGNTYKEYTVIESLKHAYWEELEADKMIYEEMGKEDAPRRMHDMIDRRVKEKMIVDIALKESKERTSINSRDKRNIRKNRKNEKDEIRNESSWNLGKDDIVEEKDDVEEYIGYNDFRDAFEEG